MRDMRHASSETESTITVLAKRLGEKMLSADLGMPVCGRLVLLPHHSKMSKV
jgi:hypothetical protein